MTVTRWVLLGIIAGCVLVCLFVGCTGRGHELAGRDARPTTPESPLEPLTFSLSPSPSLLVPLPSSLPTPDGVDADVWKLLTSELERQLVEVRGASRVGDGLVMRTVSTPPQTLRSGTLLVKTATELTWGYYSSGDYDQNSEVNLADLAQLALHYMESALPFKFPINSIQAVIDGDYNGEINLADITPIALNFQNNVEKYNLYRSKDNGDYPDAHDSGNGSAERIASVLLGSAEGDRGKERLQFTAPLPEGLDGDYFWVRPVDNEAVEGIASNLAGPYTNIFTLDGYVFMAGGGTDPLPGVPVALSGDATDSVVTDMNGHYSFEVVSGEYTVTPSGDPYGYAPEFIETSITNADKYLSPIYPAPVDIIHRWGLEGQATGGMVSGDLQFDGDDHVYITGSLNNFGNNTFYLLKYDLFGELIWSQVYDLPFGITGSRLFLLPGGEMYICGDYNNFDSPEYFYHDLYVMKVDSSGNLLWDFAFNYPTIEEEEHPDVGVSGYVDGQDNLLLWTTSWDDVTFGPEVYSYSLKISPAGNLLEQTHYEPGSATYSHMTLGFMPDPWGGMFVSGAFMVDTVGTGGLLIRLLPNGETDWVNRWGGSRVRGGGGMFGSDDYFYQKFRGHPPGDDENQGDQFARLDQNGEKDWEVLLTTEYHYFSFGYDIGPQGKLWVAGSENVEGGMYPKSYPYVWSLQPHDGSLRFAHQWLCDGGGPFSSSSTNLARMKVNRFGVVFSTGATEGEIGEWVDHDVTVQDTNWEITHEAGFTTHTDKLTDLRDLPVSELPDVGMIDQELDYNHRTYIMLYRP